MRRTPIRGTGGTLFRPSLGFVQFLVREEEPGLGELGPRIFRLIRENLLDESRPLFIPLPLDETERAGLRLSSGVLREAIESVVGREGDV